MKIDVVIEIPKGSNIKYEIMDGKIYIDRILYGASTYPLNYGFIENTLDWDGDPLDALVVSDHSFMPGVILPVRILGAMKMIDGGEIDTKLITVIDVDPRFSNIKSLKDVSPHVLKEIEDFFQTYKNLQKKKVEVNGFEGLEFAVKELEETKSLFKKYAKTSNYDKDVVMKQLMKDHPEKY